ncbi:hypothetical protein LCGC14_2440600 [marine sediment metagenome]|uniref:Uncharacterized protein n=1 Tax=marine sediment metagenome TaxID=412755 RepID=A0A0F9C6J4_9ZZZZ
MNATETIKSIRKDSRDRRIHDRERVALIQKHKAVIDLLEAGDWSWRIRWHSRWADWEVMAEIHCDNEADVKAAARLARSVCHSRSEKEFDSFTGTLTYCHVSKDKLIALTVTGGAPLPGCELVTRVTYTEPVRQERFQIICK